MEENKNNGHHKINTVIFVILFLIALLFEIYWIMNYPDDIFLIVGIGLIAVIMGFFAFEGITDTYVNIHKQNYEQNEMLIKTQKALYLATKKNSAMLETRSEQNIEAIKYLVMKMSENQQQMTTLIKENNEEMAKRIETSGSEFSNSDITQLVEKLNKSNERLTKEVQAAVTVNELVKSNAELVKNVREVLSQSASTMAYVSNSWEEPATPEIKIPDPVVVPEPAVMESPQPEVYVVPKATEEVTEPIVMEESLFTSFEDMAEEVPTMEVTEENVESEAEEKTYLVETAEVMEEPQETTEAVVEEVTEAYSYIEDEAAEVTEELETEIEIEESAEEVQNVETDLEENSEEAVEEPEEPAAFEAPQDNGGMLSPEEIAALFAQL